MTLPIETAQNIIRSFQEKYPVQTVPIADALGINVYKVPNWGDDLSGMIRLDTEYGGDSGYAIFVNADHPEVRRRFTIAHEIGHFVLHNYLIGDGVSDDAMYRSKLSSRVEAQANRFAADLLMPWHLVNRAIDENHANRVEDLARLFNVSKSAMSIRLGVPYEQRENGVSAGTTAPAASANMI